MPPRRRGSAQSGARRRDVSAPAPSCRAALRNGLRSAPIQSALRQPTSGVSSQPRLRRDASRRATRPAVPTPGRVAPLSRWAPDTVCSSWRAAKRSTGSRSARRTSAGHRRRWMSVTFPLTSLVRTTSGESARRFKASKIAWLDGWLHQLPRIGSPATTRRRLVSVRERTRGASPARPVPPSAPSQSSCPDDERSPAPGIRS